MSLPTNKIKKIKLPGDVDGNKTYEIIPEKMQNSGYEAALPTLTQDSTIALTSDIPTIPTNYVTTDTSQTVSGAKTFSATDNYVSGCGFSKSNNLLSDTYPAAMRGLGSNPFFGLRCGSTNYYLQATSSGLFLGPTSSVATSWASNGDMTVRGTNQPKWNSKTLATTDQLPTVNNATITITQGGTTKGSFTLNQSSDQTIALDAGGGGGGSSNPALEITEVDKTSGSTASLDPGKCYNFGSRGVSATETITLTFNTSYSGEFIMKIFAKNYDVTLATNISSSILDVSTALIPGVSVSGSNIILSAGYVYLLSIVSGIIYGTYVDRAMIGNATNMVLSTSGILTFNPPTFANTFKLNNTTVSASGTDVSSIISAGTNSYTFVSSDSTGKYVDYTQTLSITAPSSISAPTNLTLNSSTLTWTAPSGITVAGYHVHDNNGNSADVTTTSANVTDFSGTIYVAAKVNIITSSTGSIPSAVGYSIGQEASIVKS